MSAKELGDLIQFLGPRNILPAREWMQQALAGTLASHHICLTFDDNLRCQFDVAYPVLRKHGLTAFWFVYTSVVDGALERLELYRLFRTICFADVDAFYQAFFETVSQSKHAALVVQSLESFNPQMYLAGFPFYTDADRRFRFVRDEVLGPELYHPMMDALMQQKNVDVRTLAQNLWMDAECLRQLHREGHVIGLHSHTHPTRVEQLDEAGQRREYHTNHVRLTEILGEAPVTMSHPCNSYNATTLSVLRELGIRLGFRANMADVPRTELEWPREDHANLLKRIYQ